MIEVRPNKRTPPNLSLYMRSKYLLMSPYLEGSNFEKISGDTGEIAPDWREKGGKLQRITRTLDAFQHYVVTKSDGKLLIGDLQGNIQQLLYLRTSVDQMSSGKIMQARQGSNKEDLFMMVDPQLHRYG
jgi:hypothetical protein